MQCDVAKGISRPARRVSTHSHTVTDAHNESHLDRDRPPIIRPDRIGSQIRRETATGRPCLAMGEFSLDDEPWRTNWPSVASSCVPEIRIPMRDYQRIESSVRASIADAADLNDRMQIVIDAIWDACAAHGVSWVGFYLEDPDAPEESRLVLGPRRDKPACSPIGLHGVCGAAYVTRCIQIVRDIRELGDSYVACDPRDLSEIVIPLFDASDPTHCWSVLDLDSFDVGAFDEQDARGLIQILRAAGFTTPESNLVRTR